jgi:hypothetical protein
LNCPIASPYEFFSAPVSTIRSCVFIFGTEMTPSASFAQTDIGIPFMFCALSKSTSFTPSSSQTFFIPDSPYVEPASLCPIPPGESPTMISAPAPLTRRMTARRTSGCVFTPDSGGLEERTFGLSSIFSPFLTKAAMPPTRSTASFTAEQTLPVSYESALTIETFGPMAN